MLKDRIAGPLVPLLGSLVDEIADLSGDGQRHPGEGERGTERRDEVPDVGVLGPEGRSELVQREIQRNVERRDRADVHGHRAQGDGRSARHHLRRDAGQDLDQRDPGAEGAEDVRRIARPERRVRERLRVPGGPGRNRARARSDVGRARARAPRASDRCASPGR